MSVTALARQPDIGLHGRLDALVRPEFRVDVLVPAPPANGSPDGKPVGSDQGEP